MSSPSSSSPKTGSSTPISTTMPITSETSSTPSLPSEVYTTLITNTSYLSGLLTLDYSLKKVGSKYPLVALYTDTFPPEGLSALRSRGIPHLRIPYLLPSISKDFTNDPRFYDCWSKLTPFGLTQFNRVVQLDSDMLILRNMDDLFDIPLDPSSLGGTGSRVFAASHACVCNPLGKPHYPRNWIPSACAFTSQHHDPSPAQHTGAPSTHGLGIPNGGLQVVTPSTETYNLILSVLEQETSKISTYDFADQSLLGDLFHGRWVALPYVYNALKTLRWQGVHDPIWRDDQVRCLHYILSPKPWELLEEEGGGEAGKNKNEDSQQPQPQPQPIRDNDAWFASETYVNGLWRDTDRERRRLERESGIDHDGF